MWEGNYMAEPFDLRLTVLRLFRSLRWILLFSLLGTILFGGGYYVKNVLLGEKPRYEQTITCKLEYTNPPVQSGDYYINDMTWNTYVDSDEFRALLLSDGGAVVNADQLSARVASDIHVPSFTVSCLEQDQVAPISQAVQNVVTGAFVEITPELAAAQVIDVSDVTLVYPDVRPLRALILSAVLSCFFVVVIFLLREIGADSIWLPATLRRRYGLPVLGTLQSAEFVQNAGHLCKGKKCLAVCSTEEKTDLQNVTKALQEKLQNAGDEADELRELEWKTAATPICEKRDLELLRQADGVLLAVPAGLHAGKPLEYLLEFLRTQEIAVMAVLLWEADEKLIRSYYLLPGGRR
ncbi:MAG: hypothetical protein IJ716_07945 [Lachnospiraceae bacterium]|nr:hypothetical protein [Lachnospiraceae bacterium]